VVLKAAFDVNQSQGKESWVELEMMVLDIRARNVLHALEMLLKAVRETLHIAVQILAPASSPGPTSTFIISDTASQIPL